MDKEPMHVVSFSGGKDSTAMLVRMLELKMPVDRMVFAETFWEFDAMYEFHRTFYAWMDVNYPEVEKIVVKTKATWDQWFHGKVTRGKAKGMTRGWPLSYFPCWWSREAKFKPLDKACEGAIRYIGYAADEKRRLAGISMTSADSGYTSPLAEWGWAENDCLDYLESKGLAVQLHRDFNRTGCFHCPKQPFDSLMTMCEKYPNEWRRLKELDASTTSSFNPKWTLKDVEDAVHDKMMESCDWTEGMLWCE
jgi:3'-phosphoadenosine 5'-phosphosulfate sulfotransferase (PAPS reductase)/FAD synthetase